MEEHRVELDGFEPGEYRSGSSVKVCPSPIHGSGRYPELRPTWECGVEIDKCPDCGYIGFDNDEELAAFLSHLVSAGFKGDPGLAREVYGRRSGNYEPPTRESFGGYGEERFRSRSAYSDRDGHYDQPPGRASGHHQPPKKQGKASRIFEMISDALGE